jgi:predicted regulator of Ras-like GTPase activity (Roadblock/LC7/MglB family)
MTVKELDLEKYEDILKNLLANIPEILSAFVIDINANMIASYTPQEIDSKMKDITISAALHHLSGRKIGDYFSIGTIEQLMIRGANGYIITMGIDGIRYLFIHASRDVKLSLIFLDSKRACEKLAYIKYEMPPKSINLEKKLITIEDEFKEHYRIFMSYVKSDSEVFKIPEIAKTLEKNNPNIEVMYFEKSLKAGEEIMDYMENGVNWCNKFLWFHSARAMQSVPVKKEYKMAEYLGKDIITITTDFNALPTLARTTWVMSYIPNIEELCKKIIDDLRSHDLKRRVDFE